MSRRDFGLWAIGSGLFVLFTLAGSIVTAIAGHLFHSIVYAACAIGVSTITFDATRRWWRLR